MNDLRYAVRTLLRNSGVTLLIVASLAIGIGANTAVFSVVNALLLKRLPYPDPDRLAVLWLRSPGINIPQDWPSPGQYIDLQNENHSFQEMSISQGRSASLFRPDQPERVEVLFTSSSLFHLLGASPLYGRLLVPDDDKPGQPPVVILSNACWKRLFNADPAVVGKSVVLNGVGRGPGDSNTQFTVIGVLPPDFVLNDEIMPTVASITQMDVFLPLPFGADAVNRRGDENYNLMARLAPGVTMAQAQDDVAAIAARIRVKDKRDKTFTISVVPLADQVVGDVRRAVLVLLGSVAMVLLIACANVANLLLAKASGRKREMAVRAAIGAGRGRLVRQLLTESVLLGLLGGAGGLLVAQAGIAVVHAINPGNIPRVETIAIDGSVLAFTLIVSILTGVVFGLAPALRAATLDLNSALNSGGRGAQDDAGFGASRRRLRSLLVVSELAFALMLLIGAGLLIRSFIRLQSVSPGFAPDHVISMRIGATGRPSFANRDQAIEFFRQMWGRVAAVPGVTLAGGVTSLPFTSSVGWGGINVEGFTPQPGQELQVDQRNATPDYFRAMNVPLITGRFFSDFDSASNAEGTAIVDEKFAKRFWPNESAIGKHVWNDSKRQLKIVGVVGTVKQYGLDVDGRIVVYRPAIGLLPYVVARTSTEPTAAAAAIVRAIHESDPTIPIYDVQTMQERMRGSLARQRFATIMLGAFAAFALILSVVGVYGVMSYLVTQGTHEIGVRMALGAQPESVLGLVLRQGLTLTGAGIAAGLIGAIVLTRVMASLLFGISATDGLTFSIVPVVLAGVACVACYLPAQRATRVDPVIALRNE